MDLEREFKLDVRREEEGVWIETGASSRILVARYGNKKFQAAADRMSKPYQTGRRGSVPEDVAHRIMVRAVAAHVLLGWEGITDGGKAVAYSAQEAERLLEKYPQFLERVLGYAQNLDLFKEERDAELEKNS